MKRANPTKAAQKPLSMGFFMLVPTALMTLDNDLMVSGLSRGISKPNWANESVPATPAPPLIAISATRFPGGGGQRPGSAQD